MRSGNNEIIICQLTMIEAIQMYLDHCFKNGLAPEVASVEQNNTSYDTSFKIKCAVPAQEETEMNDTMETTK